VAHRSRAMGESPELASLAARHAIVVIHCTYDIHALLARIPP